MPLGVASLHSREEPPGLRADHGEPYERGLSSVSFALTERVSWTPAHGVMAVHLDGVEEKQGVMAVQLDGVEEKQGVMAVQLDGVEKKQGVMAVQLDGVEKKQGVMAVQLDGVEKKQ